MEEFSPSCPAVKHPASVKKKVGTKSRPDLYLLGRPRSNVISPMKLPKVLQILQRLVGIMMNKEVTEKEAATNVTNEIKAVWKHHFGILL